MRRAAALALAVASVAACGSTPSGPSVTAPDRPASGDVQAGPAVRPDDDPPVRGVDALARAQIAFAFDLYRALASQDPDDGLVLGPNNIHTALLLARAGARGDTAQEMDDVLHLEGLDDDPLAVTAALDRALRSRGHAGGVQLALASRAWVDERLPLRAEYVAALGTVEAALAELDIAGDPEQARETVNAWVADATRDKIDELLPKGAVDGLTRLILTTAVHLDADWRTPFEPDRTTPASFHLVGGSEADVDTMHLTASLPVARGATWSAVRLPYRGGDLSMTVIAPDDLAVFEAGLDVGVLDDLDAAFALERVDLALPRFTVRQHVALTDHLAALGMPSAFDPARADFSGMTDVPDLLIDAVEHEAVVEVDEQGTEAAAATAIVARVTSAQAPPTPLSVDRPFLFLLRDDATGAVLFLGRVTDPR